MEGMTRRRIIRRGYQRRGIGLSPSGSGVRLPAPLIGLIAGFIFIVIGLLLYLSHQRLQKVGVRTTGTVVEYEYDVSDAREDSSGDIYVDEGYRAVIEFETEDGKTVRFQGSKLLDVAGPTDVPVPVIYDPERPANAVTADELDKGAWSLGLVAAGILALAGGAYGTVRGRKDAVTEEPVLSAQEAGPAPAPGPLDAYVRDARASGQDDAAIRKALTDSGWQEADIARALSGTPKA